MPFSECDALGWLERRGVSRETLDRLARFAAMVAQEQQRQNLVSGRTLPEFWSRHIVDAAQLTNFAGAQPDNWLDVGSGAGVPGIVTAILTGARTRLVEPRRRRAEFLHDVVAALELEGVTVHQMAVEQLRGASAGVITARAVAALPKLIEMTAHLADPKTLWILPKGRSAQAELESLPKTWQGEWTMHRSITDADSFILVGRNVRIERGS